MLNGHAHRADTNGHHAPLNGTRLMREAEDDARPIYSPGAVEPEELAEIPKAPSPMVRRFIPADATFDGTVRSVVKGMIGACEVGLLYGPSSVGKSFFAMWLAFLIALGTPFVAGHRVRRGGVLYFALEGGSGLRHRVQAAREKYGDPGKNLLFVDRHLSLANNVQGADGVTFIIDEIRRHEAQTGERVALIVIDTVSVAMAGDEENAAAAVSAFMAKLRAIAETTGVAVLAVHHTGKKTESGLRGSSAFRANADFVIEVLEGGAVRLDKARDGRQKDLGTLILEPLVLGIDDDGDEIGTCTVSLNQPTPDQASSQRQRAAKLSPQHTRALTILKELSREKGFDPPLRDIGLDGIAANKRPRIVWLSEWRKECIRLGLTGEGNPGSEVRAMARAIKSLLGGGFIEFRSELNVVWFIGHHARKPGEPIKEAWPDNGPDNGHVPDKSDNVHPANNHDDEPDRQGQSPLGVVRLVRCPRDAQSMTRREKKSRRKKPNTSLARLAAATTPDQSEDAATDSDGWEVL